MKVGKSDLNFVFDGDTELHQIMKAKERLLTNVTRENSR